MYELLLQTRAELASNESKVLVDEIKSILQQLGIDDFVESIEWIAEDGVLTPSDQMALAERDTSGKLSIFREDRRELTNLLNEIERYLSPGCVISVIRDLGDVGWQNPWQQREQSQEVGSFQLCLGDENEGLAEFSANGRIPIFLPKNGYAFGSGQHCTTRACLMALSRLESFISGKNCLDIGAGNGVLAIAAAKFNANTVLATEIDEGAVREARKNAESNCVNIAVQLTDAVPAGKFDLICCNILLPELLRLMPDLARALAPGGKMLVAGFHRVDADRVEKVAENIGLRGEANYNDQDWSCLQFTSL